MAYYLKKGVTSFYPILVALRSWMATSYILVLLNCEDIGLEDIAHMQQKSRVLPNFLRVLKGLTINKKPSEQMFEGFLLGDVK